ncbi:secretory lipase, putative [Talaromyces stipitatus ATCC 10500]|uniref:Secretory lipase, putative n=1 Tax=Talaromyces stipitatus (strain ATCC 10500 / CBS 375.48 / QM 6759 / NRRL 1006) TaxID=441959 RepID=B8MRF4_TALSN|nr:secretory lipase, putative [Talaromyces stipitatus ATCC 10500]EED13091.1 secretory lipase, putative [Talaromyces stipitatus ATCC 10500]
MYLHFRFLSLVAFVGAGASIVAATGSSSTCDALCLEVVQNGSSWEIDQHASRDFSFYATPSNFSFDLSPGSLITVEPVTQLLNYSIPSGLSMSRIIYTTNDLNGTTLPTSAYILWPYTPLTTSGHKDQGYPMVAWAHGTSGVLRGCAPSNYRNLQYHFMTPFLLALQGMVVVAPDYAGLGVDTLPNGQKIGHPWLSGPAQANDLANAAIAARKAFPDLLTADGPFVAMGHSQGGGATWAFAEKQVKEPISGYKGTVAIAPTTRTFDHLKDAFSNITEPWAQVIIAGQPKLISAVTAAFPSYNYSGLTPVSYDRWFNVLKPLDGCLPTDSLAFTNVTVDELAVPNWYDAPEVQEYAKLAENGRKKFKGPLLIVSGEADIVVPLDTVESAVDDTCKMLKDEHWNESLELVTYSAMDHFPSIQASQMKWLPWIKDQLTGAPPPRPGCFKSAVTGIRTNDTVQTATPNFLEGWASAEENEITRLLAYNPLTGL